MLSTAEPGHLSDGEMLGLCACPRISLESNSVQILQKSCGQAHAREKIRLWCTLKILQSDSQSVDHGNIQITQHALKVSVFRIFRLGRKLEKEVWTMAEWWVFLNREGVWRCRATHTRAHTHAHTHTLAFILTVCLVLCSRGSTDGLQPYRGPCLCECEHCLLYLANMGLRRSVPVPMGMCPLPVRMQVYIAFVKVLLAVQINLVTNYSCWMSF